jgi:hypothetical protein
VIIYYSVTYIIDQVDLSMGSWAIGAAADYSTNFSPTWTII